MNAHYKVDKKTTASPSLWSYLLVIIGVALYLAAFLGYVYSEFQSSKRAVTLDDIEQNVLSVSSGDDVRAENDEKNVFVSGSLYCHDSLIDDDFNLEVRGIKMHRDVEIYQLFEKVEEVTGAERQRLIKQGLPTKTTYYYHKWTNAPVDSSAYDSSYRDVNKESELFYGNNTKVADLITVGPYTLSHEVLDQLEPRQLVVSLASLAIPREHQNRMHVKDNYLYIRSQPLAQSGASSASVGPRVGDLRVRWYVEPAEGELSLIAKQQGRMLVPFSTPSEKDIVLTLPYLSTKEEMLSHISDLASFDKKTMRLGAVVLLCLACWLITSRLPLLSPHSFFWVGLTTRFKFISPIILAVLTLFPIISLGVLRSELGRGLLLFCLSIFSIWFVRWISIRHGRQLLLQQKKAQSKY